MISCDDELIVKFIRNAVLTMKALLLELFN